MTTALFQTPIEIVRQPNLLNAHTSRARIRFPDDRLRHAETYSPSATSRAEPRIVRDWSSSSMWSTRSFARDEKRADNSAAVTGSGLVASCWRMATTCSGRLDGRGSFFFRATFFIIVWLPLRVTKSSEPNRDSHNWRRQSRQLWDIFVMTCPDCISMPENLTGSVLPPLEKAGPRSNNVARLAAELIRNLLKYSMVRHCH